MSQSLDDVLFLLSVQRRMYEGLHALSIGATVVKGAEVAEEHTVSAKARLLPTTWTNKFTKAFGRANEVIQRSTLPLRLSESTEEAGKQSSGSLQMRVLPRRSAETVFESLRRTKNEVQDIARQLQDSYDDLMAWNRREWFERLGEHDYQRLIVAKLPTRADIVHKFGLSWGIWRIRPDEVSRAQAAELQSALADAQATARQQMDSALGQLIEEPRQRLVQALAELRERLRSGQRLSAATFNGLRDAVALIRSFSDVVDPRLLSAVGDLSRGIDNATRAANSSLTTQTEAILAQRTALLSVTDSVTSACRDAAAIDAVKKQYGVGERGLSL